MAADEGLSGDAPQARRRIKRDLAAWIGAVQSIENRLKTLRNAEGRRAKVMSSNPTLFSRGEPVQVSGESFGLVSPEEFVRLTSEQTAKQAESFMSELKVLRFEMEMAQSDLANLSDMLEVIKADAEYKSAIVNSWPRDVVGDRLTYLGTGLLGAGGAAYAFFGSPVAITASIAPAAILWSLGIVFLLWGFVSLSQWQRRRWAFFSERFEILD